MSLTMAAATALAGVLGLVGAGVSAVSNLKSQADTNEANKDINQANLDYNSAMTQAQWERDDTAHQREVADLKAAGLSPLASTNGAMNSQALGAPSPIAMQAPQFDVNALVQSALGLQKNMEEYRHNKNVERQRDTELDLQAQDVKTRADSLEIENKKVQSQIKYQAALIENESRRLAEIERSNKKNEELTLTAQQSLELERESKRYALEIEKETGGNKIPTKIYHDFNTYLIQKKIRLVALNKFIEEIGQTRSSTGGSHSQNMGFGVGVTTPGTPFNVSPSANGGSSSSQYSFSDVSKEQEIKWQKFNEEHPIPVFIDKSQYKYLFK